MPLANPCILERFWTLSKALGGSKMLWIAELFKSGAVRIPDIWTSFGQIISTYARPTFLVQSVESIRVHAESIQHRKIVFPVLFTDQITRARRSTG